MMFPKSHMYSNCITFTIVFEVLISVHATKSPWRFIFYLLYEMLGLGFFKFKETSPSMKYVKLKADNCIISL